MYQKYNGNNPVLFIKKGHYANNDDIIKVLKTDVPFYADKLLKLQHDIKNDILTIIGVNNSNQDKSERMVVSEVDSNLDEIFINALSMLHGRQKAVDKINEEWGTDIKVTFRKQENKELMEIFGLIEGLNDDDEKEESPMVFTLLGISISTAFTLISSILFGPS